ncbi:MAG: DinB family protein [Chloroflexi bacterium]|nr:DinB family protein [Chloroflexota bacterium]
MASTLDSRMAAILDTQNRLLRLLEGMDYCLDWKPDPSEWSARQVIYHLLDTPPGGLVSVVRGMISGDLTEYDLWADLDNMTPDRQTHDLERVRQDINEFFSSMENVLAAADGQDLEEMRAVVHNKTRGTDDERTAAEILERGFGGHWAGHFEQLEGLRESLGV